MLSFLLGSSGVVATVSFQALQSYEGGKNISLSFNSAGSYDDSDVIADDGNGTDILESVLNASITVDPLDLAGSESGTILVGGVTTARIGVSGSEQADFTFDHTGAGLNSKMFQFINKDGVLRFRSLNDDGNVRVDPILGMTSAGNVGIGTTAPAKKLHVMGDAAIGDTATATDDRYLYFATDGDVTTQYLKHTQNATGYSGFYFSDSISADGYIDYCDVYEGEALTELKKVKAKPLAISKDGFKKLDHSSLPTGTVVTFDISYWERKKDSKKMHFGFNPCMDLTPRWVETEDTSYFQYASAEDSLNFVDNFKYIKETKQGRNISKMVSVLVKAVQELTERIEELEKK